jgi:hypothetical protein
MASRKTVLAIAGAALMLGACASDPYYHGDQYSYGYGGGPANYDPYYTGPTVGFGLASNDRDGDRWHRDRDSRGSGRDGNGSTRQDERG